VWCPSEIRSSRRSGVLVGPHGDRLTLAGLSERTVETVIGDLELSSR
jgi:hypothetical protein